MLSLIHEKSDLWNKDNKILLALIRETIVFGVNITTYQELVRSVNFFENNILGVRSVNFFENIIFGVRSVNFFENIILGVRSVNFRF